MSEIWTPQRLIAELLNDHTGPETPATSAARVWLGYAVGAVPEPPPDAAVLAHIDALIRRATLLLPVDDDGTRNVLVDALTQDLGALDHCTGPGVAVGRLLLFRVEDGTAEYLVDRVEAGRVHVQWVPSYRRWAGEVDCEGYVARSVAEQQLATRDRRREWGLWKD